MFFRSRTLSAQDAEKLVRVVDRAAHDWLTHAPHLEGLRTVVRRGRAVPPAAVPDDVITMNSRFALQNVSTGKWGAYALVYPAEEATHRGKISVLSPAGTALLGARVGEDVFWTSAAGPEVARVRKLFYQPETAMRLALSEPAVSRLHAA